MKIYRLLGILFCLCAIQIVVNGQPLACVTTVSTNQIALENTINIPSVKSNESLPLLNKELSITVYIVHDKTGLPGITPEAIQGAVDKLNIAFEPIKLNFKICNTISIDNYQYFNSSDPYANDKDLLTQYYSKNTINLYFCSKMLKVGATGDFVGYTYMPADSIDAVFLDKKSVGSNEIVHQFGHFFNLYHTHESVFGNGLANNVNCNKTGDCCCDTPADPYLSTSSITTECEYSGFTQDVNKQYFVPSTRNYMSLNNDNCRCLFSNDQFYRIIYCLQNEKKHLW